MKLSKLLPSLAIKRSEGNQDIEITGIAHDSRRVKAGNVFVCIKGFNADGHDYIGEAIKRGARALVVENWEDVPPGMVRILVPDSRRALSSLSADFYEQPSSRLTLVGVTGTNGKTTTTYLVESIFKAAGWKTGLLGTVQYRMGDHVLPVDKTTPEAPELQQLFDRMVKEGVRAAVMEVSSHAIDLHRIDHCQFDVLVFTNLSQDHLDYHGSIEEYFVVKSRLFENASVKPVIHVINVDDPYGRKIARVSKVKTILYGLDKSADVVASRVDLTEKGTNFKVSTSTGDLSISLLLRGAFNVYNSLAAIGTSLALGVPLEAIKCGLERVVSIPGRFEMVDCGQSFMVVVDYAHTPDSLEKVLTATRAITRGGVITVFGCGGDRDKTKRPLMGKVSADLSDYIIITSDNPRSEEPEDIISQIEVGVREVASPTRYEKIVDRREAISKAISMARAGDLVLIAGKGHETGQIFKDRVVPFDDRVVAEMALKGVSCSH
ncbi:MAG: UDP-N-acetylmuramoyl-L-alanyl-D-glutamate--2,6-diaminopimelate ligase [Actinomycetota bacterium]|nr:UDP-N-acetylmuramoyl-L-alanyl-D-glutamate--2,6-diaminopimelate ligase [Actinomycetota bacterium]